MQAHFGVSIFPSLAIFRRSDKFGEGTAANRRDVLCQIGRIAGMENQILSLGLPPAVSRSVRPRESQPKITNKEAFPNSPGPAVPLFDNGCHRTCFHIITESTYPGNKVNTQFCRQEISFPGLSLRQGLSVWVPHMGTPNFNQLLPYQY